MDVSTGIRHGDKCEHLLFIMILNQIVDKVKTRGRGYRRGQKEIKILSYAGDTVMIAENENKLQRMLFNYLSRRRIQYASLYL